jgi:hypothetical protein
MNHLEQLVAEWLSYNGYFVRTAVRVGKRPNGGHEGELDVVAFHPGRQHFLHVECSLDSDRIERREEKFALKFERGRRYASGLFAGLPISGPPDQVVVHTVASPAKRIIGGGRLVRTVDLVREIMEGLKDKTPLSGAVPDTFPLLRTIQLVAAATKGRLVEPPPTEARLLPAALKEDAAGEAHASAVDISN